MNPIFDLRGEHEAVTIILSAMKKIASDIHKNNSVDLFRIGQIIEFLRTYNHNCHHEKEEKIFFPALLECNIPWTKDAISHLVNEHSVLRKNLSEIDITLQEYLSGRIRSLNSMATCLIKYISLSENHTYTENHVLMPLAEKTLSKNKQEIIFSDFRLIQDNKLGHTKHLEYYILLTKLYSDTNISYANSFEGSY